MLVSHLSPVIVEPKAFFLRAGWVVPISAPPIRDGALLVRDGRIATIGKAKDIVPDRDCLRLEFPDGILLPGFVNPHTHLENTHFADKLPRRQPFVQWLKTMRDLVRQQTWDEALTAARDGVAGLLRFGVTCVGDSSFHGATLMALREIGLRGVVFKELICPREEEQDERWQAFLAWLNDAPTGELIRLGIMAHAPYTVTPTMLRWAWQLASQRRLPFSIHAAESPEERALIERREGVWARLPIATALQEVPTGLSPIRYLDWLGVLNEGVLLIHCVQVDDADIALLARAKVWVAHCPRSNANLQVGVMPLAKMLAAGVQVCLATDGLASAESLSPLDEIRFALHLSETHPSLYPTLPPERWLQMVTLDAANALGMEQLIGSLQISKAADLTVFAIGAEKREPLEALLHKGKEAMMTMVAGRCVYLAEGVNPAKAP
jgi:cytosine/adenosine deaminase-related metal-dependent hydrolase